MSLQESRWSFIGLATNSKIKMSLVLLSAGLGFIYTTNLPPLQASAAIALLGTIGVTAGLKVLPGKSSRSLRWGQFNREQKWAVVRIATGSLLVNICGPTATALLGSGPAATATTLGSLLVGSVEMIRTRASTAIMLRLMIVIGVLYSTRALEGSFNVLGAIVAALAALHFMMLPGALKKLDDRADQGMVVANIAATPLVVGAAVLITVFGDVLTLPSRLWAPWMFGGEQLLAMVVVALLVMVIPVFLTNSAARHLSKESLAVMQAMSAPVYGLVAVLATVVGIVNAPPLNGIQWGGVVLVFLAGACAETSKRTLSKATTVPAPSS